MDYEEDAPRGEETEKEEEEEVEGIPDPISSFLRQLEEYVRKGDADQVMQLYEQEFHKLTERYYKNARWPAVDDMLEASQVKDPYTIILYKEMYSRHLHGRLPQQVDFLDRKASWENYVELINMVLDTMEKGTTVEMPAQWVWDILDEFIYQFHTFTSARNKAVKAQAESVQFVKENPDMWSTVTVYSLLHRLVDGSKVRAYLAKTEEQRLAVSKDETSLFFGYFALVELLRVECLFADYYMALRTVDGLDYGPVALYHKVPACHTAVYYYTGFSYLMMRRYQDAVRTFSNVLNVLVHLSGSRFVGSYQQDQIMKKSEQMGSLLMISVALSPQKVEDSVMQNIKDKHYDKQQKLQKGDVNTFEGLFEYTCPKFISPAPVDWDALDTFNPNEAHTRQLNLFLLEVQQQQKFPDIRAYMRLYSVMPVPKLSQFLDLKPDTLRTLLMCYKYKTRQLVQNIPGPPLEGVSTSCSDINYTLDGNMMHMIAQKTQKQYTDIFLQQIVKFQDIIRTIEGKPIAA